VPTLREHVAFQLPHHHVHWLVYQCTWSRHMDDRFFIVEPDGSLQMVKPLKVGEGAWGVEPITVVV